MGGMGGMGGMPPPRRGGMPGGGPSHDVEAVVPDQKIVENLYKRRNEFGNCSKKDIEQALKETNNNKAGAAATVLRRKAGF